MVRATPASPPGGRPLVVRYAPLGDLVVLTTALRALSRRWGAPCDVLTSFVRADEVLRGLPTVGHVVLGGSRRIPYWLSPDQRRLVDWLRRRPPGPVYVVEERALDKVLWLLRRGGVGCDEIVGPHQCPRGDLEHTVDYLRRLAGCQVPAWPRTEAVAQGAEPELALAPGELQETRRWIDARGWSGAPLVLFQTLSRRANRGRWPDARWVEVVRAILDSAADARGVIAGAPHEAAEVERLVAACAHPRLAGAAADLPLRRLFGLLALAHSCISLDTGPAHAAAALGCPLVVLTGRADPRRNAPWAPADRLRVLSGFAAGSWPATRRQWEDQHRVGWIPADAVVDAWKELAAGAPHR